MNQIQPVASVATAVLLVFVEQVPVSALDCKPAVPHLERDQF
jgi:hypothetical protein